MVLRGYVISIFWCIALNAVAQQHYQLVGLAVDNFINNSSHRYEQVPITWNMAGPLQADLNDGMNYLFEREPLRAERSLDIVVTKDKQIWQAYYYRGVARRLQGNYYGAISDLKAALRLNPKSYEAHSEIAKCHLSVNALPESERAVRSAIQLDKDRATAYYIRGCLNQFRNQPKLAVSSFRECLEADSLYHDARIRLAMILLLKNKDEAGAVNELTSVLELDSLQQDALLLRSLLVFDKDKKQSLNDLTKLVRLRPQDMFGFFLRGSLFTLSEDYERAFSDFQTVIKATSTSDDKFRGEQTWLDKKIDIQNMGTYTLTRVYGLSDEDMIKLKQAFCLILINAFDRSIAILNSTSDPTGEPLTVYLQAVANEHRGRHEQAFMLYQEAIKLDNTIADAFKKKAIYEQELKRWEESIQDFSEVLRLMPDLNVIRKFRGVSYYHNKQFNEAIFDFSEYLKNDEANEQVIGYRGMAYWESNQRLNAYIDFGNSRNRGAFDEKEMLHLVDSVLLEGDTTLALNALGSFVKGNPSFTEAYTLKLKLHLRKNDWPAIEECLSDALLNVPANASKKDHSYLLTLKGMLMTKADHEVDALGAFDEAIRFDKTNGFAYLQRGKLLLVKNKSSKAADDLERAASLGSAEAKSLLKTLGN